MNDIYTEFRNSVESVKYQNNKLKRMLAYRVKQPIRPYETICFEDVHFYNLNAMEDTPKVDHLTVGEVNEIMKDICFPEDVCGGYKWIQIVMSQKVTKLYRLLRRNRKYFYVKN